MRSRELAVEIPPEGLRHLERALKRQWQRYRTEFQRCQEKLSAKSVHESRVAARRLLATLELVKVFLSPGRLKRARLFPGRPPPGAHPLASSRDHPPNARRVQKVPVHG